MPREIVWDYDEPPRDERWRLQRLAEFFPLFGRDRVTVAALYEGRHGLRIPAEVAELIVIYAELLGVSNGPPSA